MCLDITRSNQCCIIRKWATHSYIQTYVTVIINRTHIHKIIEIHILVDRFHVSTKTFSCKILKTNTLVRAINLVSFAATCTKKYLLIGKLHI